MINHVLYETGDPDVPDCIKDRNGDVVLGLCKVCRAAEIELTQWPTCPKPTKWSQIPHEYQPVQDVDFHGSF